MLSYGFKFKPTDEELIQILDRKVTGQEMPLPFIVQANVYNHEPQELQWNRGSAPSDNERYYYCKKENDSREVLGRGWWKATSHVKKVVASEILFGNKRPLTFSRFNDKNRNRNNATKTNWIMHEYSLESSTTEWRICKIKYKGNRQFKEQEAIENTRQSCPFTDNINGESSSSRTIQKEVVDAGAEHLQYPLTLANYAGNNEIQSPSPESWNMEHQQQLPPHSYGEPSLQVPVQEQHLELTEPPFSIPWSWQN